MTKLSVNVNKIATLRNSRGGDAPNLSDFVQRICSFGVGGITIHPRADQRHITRKDVTDVTKTVNAFNETHSVKSATELNFEGDLRDEFIHMVLDHKPTQCTLVPVTHGEITSNHGWNVEKNAFILAPVIEKIKAEGIRVSLFMDVLNFKSIELAAGIGADRIEIYTEPYADAFKTGSYDKALSDIRETADAITDAGMTVNAGHDLTTANLIPLLKEVPSISEVSIGHQLICDALEMGIEAAVRGYLEATQTPLS